MIWFRYFTAAACVVCATSLVFHLVRLIRLGRPIDYSRPKGKISPGVRYSFTGAMNPAKKESAYLHLPTYAAGLLYHLGTFLSAALAVVFFFDGSPAGALQWSLGVLVSLSCLSGIGIFLKRIFSRNLRYLSVADDYISNLLVTLFQLLTLGMLAGVPVGPAYFIFTGLLLLYIPVGKLKHMLYFFAARYHLGLSFGLRGIWPAPHREE